MNEHPTMERREVWRSLDELAETPEYRDFVEGEFPQVSAHQPNEGMNRRRFFQLMGASIALAGAAGCRRPVMEILPYAKKPEDIVPGLPTFYATAIPRTCGCFPVLVESHEGRPTKIEGNPEHPLSKGKTDAFAQASILDLYDPDRSREVLRDGKPATWAEFDTWAESNFADLEKIGKKLRFLVQDLPSPALWMLAGQFKSAGWHIYEPLGNDNGDAGRRLIQPAPLNVEYKLDAADVILSLDADLFGLDENAVPHIRDFAKHRLVSGENNTANMSRLYVVENQLTVTGSMADNRLPIKGSSITAYALALAKELLSDEASPLKDVLAKSKMEAKEVPVSWVSEVIADLKANKGKSLIVAGPRQPAIVHAVVHSLNRVLGNVGKTVVYRTDSLRASRQVGSIEQLAKDIDNKEVEYLVILGGNPVLNAPSNLAFNEKLKKVRRSIHLSPYRDETSTQCTWHLPMSHFLESWGDVRANDGTYSVIQPLIAPLWVDSRTQVPLTRSPWELLARWAPEYRSKSVYTVVLESFRKVSNGKGDEKTFRQVLHQGFLAGSEYAVAPAEMDSRLFLAAEVSEEIARLEKAKGLELSFHGDYRTLDGRFANNAWMRETPDPISKLTWDNAVLVSPAQAKELSVSTGDMVKLKIGKREIEIPVFVQPGQANESLSVHIGFGRSLYRFSNETPEQRGREGAGFDVSPLRTSDAPWFAYGVEVEKTGRKYVLPSTQNHGNMTENSKLGSEVGRVNDLVQSHTLEEYLHPHEKHQHPHALPLITHPAFTGQYQWGMVIDLNKCVACNACQVACQAENNVPIVGKDEILRGREMFWIRLDRYYTGDEQNPEVRHQPVACVHCESAPCETVCPVNAAVHSPEGLNNQVYNRCIGTRYCANNCPYKVRRFNWFDYQQRPLDKLRLGPLTQKGMAETLKMQKNPDVTVRMRGVMEKCTYCVQRIERGKIDVKVKEPTKGEHPIPDGMIVPACAQACPAEAIVFGNLKDEKSRVVKLKKDKRHYVLLESVGTKPRTTYLARLRNPNTKIKSE